MNPYQEMEQEMLEEARATELLENQLRSDYEFCIGHFNLNGNMTVDDFKHAAMCIKRYHDVDTLDLLVQI